MKHLKLYNVFISEAIDTWSRAEDRSWVLLMRAGVPNIPYGDEAMDYVQRFGEEKINTNDINKLDLILRKFNRKDKPTLFNYDCVSAGGYSLKETGVSAYLEIRNNKSFNWSCKFWFMKRTFMSEDWWILAPHRPKNTNFTWNEYTNIHASSHILCDGLDGVEDFLKSYTG